LETFAVVVVVVAVVEFALERKVDDTSAFF
jgi:hypothetical protein